MSGGCCRRSPRAPAGAPLAPPAPRPRSACCRGLTAAILSSWSDDSPALIAALKQASPDLSVIVLADGGSIGLAVEAMRAGASDYLAKPIAPERLLDALQAQTDRRRA